MKNNAADSLRSSQLVALAKRKAIMKKVLLVIIILLPSFYTYSNDWVSPIDKKYTNKDPELFSKFDEARELLNSWRGQRDKLQKAGRLLQEIVEKDAEYAPAYREFGRLYIMSGFINSDNYRKGSLSPSETAILRSIEIEPDYADSYVLLGHLYTNMKRYDEAGMALKKAEEIGTETPWLPLNWADLLKKRKKYNEAMERYQYVVNSGTKNRKAYTSALEGVTTMYRYMGQYDKANAGYLDEINYEPDNAWKWGNYSSFLLFTYNDVDDAIKNGEKALSIMNYGMGRFILGCALYTKWAMLKDNPATALLAQQYFDKAWQLYPYPEKVINKTKKYTYTKITALALEKWLAGQFTGTNAAPVL